MVMRVSELDACDMCVERRDTGAQYGIHINIMGEK